MAGEGGSVLGVVEDFEAVIGGGGPVLIAGGGSEDRFHHGNGGLEVSGGHREGRLKDLDGGRVGREVGRLGKRGLALFREAGCLASLLNRCQR